MMKVGIVGAGRIGSALAELSVRAGYETLISNSRGPETLADVAASTGARAATREEAVKNGDIVIVTIPFANRTQLPSALFAGKIVVDTNNYYPNRDGAIPELDEDRTTTSEILQGLLPGSRIVKAFNAILAPHLTTDARPAGAADRRALPIAADDAQAKAIVAGFQDRIGFDVVDAGNLAGSWTFERAMPAYCIRLDKASLTAALGGARRGHRLPEGSWRS